MKATRIVVAFLIAIVLAAIFILQARADNSQAEVTLKVKVVPLVKEVDIDIMPFSRFNVIIPWSRGLIPVAILSSADFDAPREVYSRSLTFGRTGDEDSLFFCLRHPIDTNRDGLRDKICFFRCKAAGFQTGDTEGILKGRTVNDTPFRGSDSVWVIHWKRGRH